MARSAFPDLGRPPNRRRLGVDTRLVLDARGLVKYRGQAGVGFELHIPDFRLERGRFVAVVGESGCGKSTLLDMLALVLRPTRCEHFFLYEPGEGSPIDIKSMWELEDEDGLARVRRNYLGYVLQSGGLLPFLTVEKNIWLPVRVKGLKGGETDVRELAQRIGVGSLLTKKPRFLSGGERQRVAILRALSHRPIIVLADEPTAAVDKKRARSIVEDFHALARDHGSAIVMVTHDRGLVAPVADATFTFEVTQVSQALTRSICIPEA